MRPEQSRGAVRPVPSPTARSRSTLIDGQGAQEQQGAHGVACRGGREQVLDRDAQRAAGSVRAAKSRVDRVDQAGLVVERDGTVVVRAQALPREQARAPPN